jgi:hypothetical protein
MPDGTKKSAFSMTWRRLAKDALIKTLARVVGKNKRDSAGAIRAGLLTAIVAVLASPAFADALNLLRIDGHL